MLQHRPPLRSRTSAPDLTSVLFNPDGSLRLFVHDQVLPEEAPRPSSYPEPRHLVGISPLNTVQDDISAFAPAVVVPWSRELPSPLELPPLVRVGESVMLADLERRSGAQQRRESRRARELVEYQTASLLREMLAEHDPRLQKVCAVDGHVLQHNLSDRQRLAPFRCQVRSVCPCCGRAYGETRGGELVELVDVLLEPGRLVLRRPDVAAWHVVLSCDHRVSHYVAGLVDRRDRRGQQDADLPKLRRVVRHLTEDVHATVRRVFGPGVAAIVCWHWWHSSNPLAPGMHLHAHVTIPNVDVRLDPDSGEWRPTMQPLRTRGVLEEFELEELRLGFGERAAAHRWVKALGVAKPRRGEKRQPAACWQPNAHVRFTQQREGQGYAHRLRYDARVSVADLLDQVLPDDHRDSRHLHESLLGEAQLPAALDQMVTDVAEMACNWDAVDRWVQRASVWQSVQTVRYTGWLVNAARKALGLLRDSSSASEDREWSPVGVYRLVEVGSDLVRVERWREGGRYEQDWHRDHVQLLPPASAPEGWRWDDDVRPLREVGPPAAWLARGLVRSLGELAAVVEVWEQGFSGEAAD